VNLTFLLESRTRVGVLLRYSFPL